MKRLKPLIEVKKDLEKLEMYISLVENYKTETLEQKIIAAYARTSSFSKTLLEINFEMSTTNQSTIELLFIKEVIKSKPCDELHKLVRASYLSKVKSTPKFFAFNSFKNKG